MDRAGQLGRLHAWAVERLPDLAPLLRDGWVLYGEWSWLCHGVAYDAAPDWLITLDLWHHDRGFTVLEDRDERCTTSGLALSPTMFTGVLGDRRTVESLIGVSCFAAGAATEGLVLRRADGGGARWCARASSAATTQHGPVPASTTGWSARTTPSPRAEEVPEPDVDLDERRGRRPVPPRSSTWSGHLRSPVVTAPLSAVPAHAPPASTPAPCRQEPRHAWPRPSTRSRTAGSSSTVVIAVAPGQLGSIPLGITVEPCRVAPAHPR